MALAILWPRIALSEDLRGKEFTLKDLKGPVFYAPLKGKKFEYWPGLYAFEVPPVQPGVVTLSIAREGDHIKLSWTSDVDPDIYYLAGIGPGAYTNTYTTWTPAALGSGSVQTGGFSAVSNKSVLHYNQVKKGDAEVYYKALNPNTPKDSTWIPQAPAVGKVNITCDPGYNLITVPFSYASGSDTLDQVFGSQLHAGNVDTADRVYTKQQSASWGMDNAYLSTDGKWYWSNKPAELASTFALDPASGYLVRNKGSQIIITLVGAVAASPQTVSLTPGYNMIGTIYPTDTALNDLGFYGVTGVTAGNVDTGDRIYIKKLAGSWGMDNAYLSTDGKWYLSNKPGTAADFTFHSPQGYFYRMKGTGTISTQSTLK